jgi:hypothetical protein
MRIDYIFASSSLAPRLRSCEPWRMPPAASASDHYPIVAELSLGVAVSLFTAIRVTRTLLHLAMDRADFEKRHGLLGV